MSWGGEAGDVHITNIWSHGFINTYSFKHAHKRRLEGLCRHLDSLDHVVYYKITRDETGEVLYDVTKDNEYARRYFASIEPEASKPKRKSSSSRSRDKVSGGATDDNLGTSKRSGGRPRKKPEKKT